MRHSFFQGQIIDDLMRDAVEAIRRYGEADTARRGSFTELTGVMLLLENPRARLSRTETRGRVFSALGEFCWYLAGREDLASIEYYLRRYKDEADQGILQGAYGPRLVGPRDDDQLSRVIKLLKKYPTSRKAVIRIFDAIDLRTGQKDVPCTCTLQFILRGDQLHMVTYMRSNDVYRGLPHDVFCFTLLQEWVARCLGAELGTYKQVVGSLHIYDHDEEKMDLFLKEGFQSTLSPMPSMPAANPEGSLKALLQAEAKLRAEVVDWNQIDETMATVAPYWADLIRLLCVHRHFKDAKRSGGPHSEAILDMKYRMDSDVYHPFIDRLVDLLQNA